MRKGAHLWGRSPPEPGLHPARPADCDARRSAGSACVVAAARSSRLGRLVPPVLHSRCCASTGRCTPRIIARPAHLHAGPAVIGSGLCVSVHSKH